MMHTHSISPKYGINLTGLNTHTSLPSYMCMTWTHFLISLPNNWENICKVLPMVHWKCKINVNFLIHIFNVFL